MAVAPPAVTDVHNERERERERENKNKKHDLVDLETRCDLSSLRTAPVEPNLAFDPVIRRDLPQKEWFEVKKKPTPAAKLSRP